MTEDQKKLITKLMESLPTENDKRQDAATDLFSGVQKAMAGYLKPIIIDLLRTPPESFLDKQERATDINHLLNKFGLAISHPNMPHPCGVVASRSQTAKAGWIRLQYRKRPHDHTSRQSSPSTKLDLEQLELVEAPREEPFAGWRRGGRESH